MTQPRRIPSYDTPEYATYQAALVALGPVNSAEKAAQYRCIWEQYHGVKLPDAETSASSD